MNEKFLMTVRELVQANKDRCEDVWEEDEAHKTEYVLEEIERLLNEM